LYSAPACGLEKTSVGLEVSVRDCTLPAFQSIFDPLAVTKRLYIVPATSNADSGFVLLMPILPDGSKKRVEVPKTDAPVKG
jgi:hypothetical protein